MMSNRISSTRHSSFLETGPLTQIGPHIWKEYLLMLWEPKTSQNLARDAPGRRFRPSGNSFLTLWDLILVPIHAFCAAFSSKGSAAWAKPLNPPRCSSCERLRRRVGRPCTMTSLFYIYCYMYSICKHATSVSLC